MYDTGDTSGDKVGIMTTIRFKWKYPFLHFHACRIMCAKNISHTSILLQQNQYNREWKLYILNMILTSLDILSFAYGWYQNIEASCHTVPIVANEIVWLGVISHNLRDNYEYPFIYLFDGNDLTFEIGTYTNYMVCRRWIRYQRFNYQSFAYTACYGH